MARAGGADHAWGRGRQRPDLAPAAAHAAIVIWTRIHGIVSLELTGLLGTRPDEVQRLIDAEVTDAVRSLGTAGPLVV